jgi:hypothetical protein
VSSALLGQGFTSLCVPNAWQMSCVRWVPKVSFSCQPVPSRKRINTGGYRPHVLQSLGVGLGLGFQLGDLG